MDAMTFIALPEHERDKLWNKAQDHLTEVEIVYNDKELPIELKMFTDIVHLGELIGEMASSAKEAAMLVQHVGSLLTPMADASWAYKECRARMEEINKKYKRLSQK